MAYEPPTRRIPPDPPRGTVRETEYVADPEREELRDRIRSLRTALVLTALLATAALGLGLYALLADDDEEDTGRRGASPARVSNLDDRVDELENRIDDRATKNSVEQLEDRQQELATQLEEAGNTGDAEELQQSVQQLSSDVNALEQRVEEIEANQAGGTPP